MYRKTQLAAGTAPEGHTHLNKVGVAPPTVVFDGESLASWGEKTQSVITGVKKGTWPLTVISSNVRWLFSNGVFLNFVDMDVIRENLEAMSVYVRSPAPTNQSASSVTTLPYANSSTSDLKLVSVFFQLSERFDFSLFSLA